MPLDNGKIYAVWGYRNLKLAELKPDLSGIVPGNERELFPKDSQMGEGSHRYKIGDQYFILSAWWDGRMRMAAARAKNILGPWEVDPAISADEDFGLAPGNRLVNDRSKTDFTLKPHDPAQIGRMSMHQPPGARTTSTRRDNEICPPGASDGAIRRWHGSRDRQQACGAEVFPEFRRYRPAQ